MDDPAALQPGSSWSDGRTLRAAAREHVDDEGRYRMVVGDPGNAYRDADPKLLLNSAHPDTALDAGWVGDLDVRAASVRGLAHRYAAVVRQDAYGFARDRESGWFIAVVADGVSAGRLSHDAARLVAHHGPRMVAERLRHTDPVDLAWHELFSQLGALVLRAGHRSLVRDSTAGGPAHREQGGESGVEPDAERVAAEMATTATFVVCGPLDEVHGRRVVVAWLGDSPVWALRAEGWMCLSEIKGHGRDVCSSTVAALPRVPESAADLPVRDWRIDADDAVFVMTDGVGDPLGDGTGEVAVRLADAWSSPPDPLDFAAQVGFGRKSYDDDRTVVGIWSRGRPR